MRRRERTRAPPTLRAASSSVVSRLCTSITTIAPRDVLKFLLISVRTSSTVLKSSCAGEGGGGGGGGGVTEGMFKQTNNVAFWTAGPCHVDVETHRHSLKTQRSLGAFCRWNCFSGLRVPGVGKNENVVWLQKQRRGDTQGCFFSFTAVRQRSSRGRSVGGHFACDRCVRPHYMP